MDIHIELQDTDAKFSLFASSTYELAFGGLSVHMNADQFQQLCDNLRPWVVEDTTPQPSADAVREYVTELRAQADQKMGVAGACAHDGDRARYKSAAQLLRRVADELESLLSAASGEGIDDTKRLDWIARQGGYEFDFGILNDQPGDGDWFVHGMGGSGQGATFRDAIDAAIKEEAGGQDANTDILDTLAFKTENGDAGRGSVTYIALVASGEADHQQNAAQGGGADA